MVINGCYGGFGVSREALIELYKRGSVIVDTYEPKKYYGTEDWERRFKEDEKNKRIAVFNGLIITASSDRKYRTNKELIKLIEEWGSEKVSGQFAKLKIIDIPDDIDWSISDYDGNEHVEEYHREWS